MDLHQPNYDYIIFQIDKVFNVVDIMTSTRDLKFAPDIDKAREISQDCDYDVVPLGVPANMHKYYDRETDRLKDIKKENLLARDTGIAALVSYLEKGGFYFILEYNNIIGLVNRSDLNKLLSFLPLYVTSLHAEYAIRRYLRRKSSDLSKGYEKFLSDLFQRISKVVDKDGLNNSFNFQDLDREYRKAKEIGFYTDIFDELEFWQELSLYYFLKEKLNNQNDWNRIREFKEIRNRTMHIKDQLSYSNTKENLEQLLRFLNECTEIIHEGSPAT